MDDASYFSESNISPIIIIPHVILSFIATVLVGLRIYTSRYITKTSTTLDEWITIVALLINHAIAIVEGICVHYGYGQNIVVVMRDYGGPSDFLRTFVLCEVGYGLGCALSKIAVLSMYYRIFSTSKTLRYATWILCIMISGWGIATVLVSIFSCNPIRGFWDKTIPSKCVDTNKFFIGITIPNIIFDILTVALPVNEVWKLQLHRDKKWAITSIFLLGGSVVIASIARLVLYWVFHSSQNITQVMIFGHLASSSEIVLAIIGACLPSCAPLLKRMMQRFVSTVGDNTEGTAGNAPRSALVTVGQIRSRGIVTTNVHRGKDEEGSFERLDDNGSFQESTDGLYVNGSESARNEGKPGVWKQIHIQREFEVGSVNGDIPMREL
ncbi:hypothetical protein FVEN_g6711 [Fusarium venenatum]|uniref:uncharacterized protein n=1 Tax=Fusarium venenatum TaxID=56646 RepID=UPI001DEE3ADB|nr:hypothetical protein FVEN_g6711 [Fusarium venenatum]KAH7006650.1 hypothetical protein EDB82DRAFT_553125 [Fusarium venenatum]